jgi:hypothetical protein
LASSIKEWRCAHATFGALARPGGAVKVKVLPTRDNPVSFDDTVKVALRWLISLTAAINERRYFDAWLASVQLGVWLDRAEHVADLMVHESQLHAASQLHALRVIAAPILAVAPRPSRREVSQLRPSGLPWPGRLLAHLEDEWARSLQRQTDFSEVRCSGAHC